MMQVLEEKIGGDPEKAEELVEARFTMPNDSGGQIKITCYKTTLGEGLFLARWDHPDGDTSWDIQAIDYFEILEEAGQISKGE